MSETGASRVPRELLDYIKEQPLAAVAYANPVATHAHLKAPLAQSEAWTKLLGGHSLVDCLFEEQVQLLLAMLTGRRGQHEEMDLELRLPTTKNTLHLHLKLSRSIRLLVLTAIPPEPISYSTPTSAAQSPKHSSRAEGGPHPTRPSLTTTISTGAPPPILPRPQPPTFRLPRDSPVGTFELCSLAWDAPIGLLWADRNLNVLWCNKRWFQLAGLPADGNPNSWPAQVHPEDVDVVQAFAENMADTLEPCELEFRWISNDDTESWCVSNLDVVRSPDTGEVTNVIGSLYNISKRKTRELQDLRARAAERAAALSMEREMALLSKTASVGLSRSDLEGNFSEVNDAWRSIVGLSADQPLHEWTNKIYDDEERERVLALWQNALKTMEPLELNIRWVTDEVSLVNVVPNDSDHSKATGWMGSIVDVTAQKRGEQALLSLSQEREANARQAAEEAEARRQEVVEEKRQQELFLDVASHEIRNPISAILQNSEYTRSSLEDLKRAFTTLQQGDSLPDVFSPNIVKDLDEDIEALDSIHSCGLAQERIANDILGLAQIQLSRYKITPTTFDLAQSLRNILRLFKTEAKAKDIELTLEMGSSIKRLGPHCRVFADPTRLAQVCINLLSNAIRFTAQSKVRKVKLAVEVSAMAPNRLGPLVPPKEVEFHIDKSIPVYLFFSVTDTGSGISKEDTDQLFSSEPFFHTTMGGTGLGLWIVKHLCELQAGGVEVESEVGKGSTFRAFITARSVDAGLPPEESAEKVPVVEGVKNAGSNSVAKVVLSKTVATTTLEGMTILCCEDNAINRKVLERQLKKAGAAKVLLAFDGQEGLAAFDDDRAKRKIDAIIMDIEMPVLDGLAATRAIREREKLTVGKRMRIVGLSGNARPAQIQAGMDAGMDSFVTKPYRVLDLLSKLVGEEEVSFPNVESTELPPTETPAQTLRETASP